MAGCFGNSMYDRYLENQLDRYLDSLDEYQCPHCESVSDITSNDVDDEDLIICPHCGKNENGETIG